MWSAEAFLHELETKKVHQILMSFTNSFRTVHSPILNMDPSLNLSKVYALVISKSSTTTWSQLGHQFLKLHHPIIKHKFDVRAIPSCLFAGNSSYV